MLRYFLYNGHGFANENFVKQFDCMLDLKAHVKEHKIDTLSIIDWDEQLMVKTDCKFQNLQWRYDSDL